MQQHKGCGVKILIYSLFCVLINVAWLTTNKRKFYFRSYEQQRKMVL